MARRSGSLHLKAIPKGVRTYYHLATSFRDGPHVRTRYLHHFGALTPQQADGLRHWLGQWTTLGPGCVPSLAASPQEAIEFEENLPSFRHGIVALGHAAFGRIGLRSALNDAFGRAPEKGFRLKLVEAMVLNRLEDPSSKLRLAEEWYARTSLPHLLDLAVSSFDEDDLYETMDLLDARRDRLEALVYERVVRPLEGGTKSGVLMKDISSTYFEGRGVRSTLEAKGYSRDRVRGSLQVNWSLVLTPKGYPVTLEVYSGNTKDESTVAGTVERLQRVFGLTEGTFVGDRGMLTGMNLKRLHAAGFHYVVAETLCYEPSARTTRRPESAVTPFSPRRGGYDTSRIILWLRPLRICPPSRSSSPDHATGFAHAVCYRRPRRTWTAAAANSRVASRILEMAAASWHRCVSTAARRLRSFKLVRGAPTEHRRTDAHEFARRRHCPVDGFPALRHPTTDLRYVPLLLEAPRLPLGLDENPLQQRVAVPDQVPRVAPFPGLARRWAQPTVLHHRIEVVEPINRAEERDERHRRDRAYPGDRRDELGLLRLRERVEERLLQRFDDLLKLDEGVQSPVHLGDLAASQPLPSTFTREEVRLVGNPLL